MKAVLSVVWLRCRRHRYLMYFPVTNRILSVFSCATGTPPTALCVAVISDAETWCLIESDQLGCGSGTASVFAHAHT